MLAWNYHFKFTHIYIQHTKHIKFCFELFLKILATNLWQKEALIPVPL